MLKGKSQLPAETVIKDRRIASKCVHVECLIVLAKTYKILTQDPHHSKVPLGSRIIFVCFMLQIFCPSIIKKNA